MDNLTTEQRLENLESGIIKAANKLFDVITDTEVDGAISPLRERLNDLNKRLKTLAETAETAYNITAESED